MDSDLKLREDVELGYRLAQRGAVFVPDNEARSWHLGRSTLMRRQEEVNRYNRPFVTDRITDLRHWRTKGRSYSVPWLQAVVDTEGKSFESVSHTVDGLLRGSVADIEIVILIAYAQLETAEARAFQPSVVFVDADNRVVGTGHDPAEALPGTGLVRGDAVAS